jgi:hypothetical protein
MKRILHLAVILLSLTNWSFGQRTGDLEAKFIYPNDGYLVTFGSPLTLQFRLYNHGPSDITAEDTIKLSLFNNGIETFIFPDSLFLLRNLPIAVGDSTDIFRQVAYTQGTQSMEWTINTCYEFYVRNAVNPFQELNVPNNRTCRIFNVQNNSNVGIEDLNANTFTLYPNPVHNELSIDLPIGAYEITAFHLDGRMRASISGESSATPIQINTSDWESGVYMIQIKQGNKISNQRVVRS